MAAIITPGFSFSDGVQDQGSAANLNAFAASCTITGIGMSEFSATAHGVQAAATTPSGNQGESSGWFDTTLNIYRQLDDTRYDCHYEGAGMAASEPLPLGAWVVASADNTMSACITALWPEVLGVLTSTTISGAVGIVRRTGLAPVRALGPLSYGDVLVAAPAFGGAGYSRGATMVFGNTSFTGGIEIGMSLQALVGATTGTVTAIVWR